MKNNIFVLIWLFQFFCLAILFLGILMIPIAIFQKDFSILLEKRFQILMFFFIVMPGASAVLIEYLKDKTSLKNWKPHGF